MPQPPPPPRLVVFGLSLALGLWPAACQGPSPTPEPIEAGPIALVAPPGALPEALLDGFTRATGISVALRESVEVEALLRAGEPIDLALLPTEALPGLIEDGLLAPIDHSRLPGFRRVPYSFRDLAYDPGNRYSVPLRYGISGLILRLGAVEAFPRSWAELLSPGPGGRLILPRRPREVIGAALLAGGHDANAEDPAALAAALERWRALGPRRLQVLSPGESGAEALARPGAAGLIGRAADLSAARAAGLDVSFVVPVEGGLLWIEHLVLPEAGTRPASALRLVEHLLRPDVAAELARSGSVALANTALLDALAPDLLADRAVWPELRVLRRSGMLLPLSPAGRALHASIWEQLLALLDGAGS